MNSIDNNGFSVEILSYIRVFAIILFIFLLFIFRRVKAKFFGGRYDKYKKMLKTLPAQSDELQIKKSELLSAYNDRVDSFLSDATVAKLELSRVTFLRDKIRCKIIADNREE